MIKMLVSWNTVPLGMKKVSDVVSKGVAKTQNLLNTNVNSLENNISDANLSVLYW